MRQMQCKETGTIINVTEHIINKAGWEYYVTDDSIPTSSIVTCLVLGFEQELGDVCLEELKPYMISRTNNLQDLFPAIGWEWVE